MNIYETERLIIRKWEEKDYLDLYEYAKDKEFTRFLSFKAYESVETAKKRIDDLLKLYKEDAYPKDYAIVLKSENKVIGSITICDLKEKAGGVATLGYALSRKYQGNGYMTECVKGMFKYIKDNKIANRIEAHHDINNYKSGNVMKRCGMTFEGVMRKKGEHPNGEIYDVVVYSILVDEIGKSNIYKFDNNKFYKEVAKRQGWNFSSMKYKVFKNTQVDYYSYIENLLKENDILLDIGCGDCKKSTKYYQKAQKIVSCDLEIEMLNKAKENIAVAGKTDKYELIQLDCLGKYTFNDESFDIVVSRHCGCNTKEMYRVLKENGYFVSEDIDENDCLELKYLFGRGQGFPIKERESDKLYEEYKKLGFSEVNYYPIREVEYYETEEDLLYLLMNTPIIQNFGESSRDMEIFKNYCKTHKTDKGIRLDRELYAFVLKK